MDFDGWYVYCIYVPIMLFICTFTPEVVTAHALEESYTASTLAQHKWSTFLTFSCMSQSRECIHSTSAHSVAQFHGKSTECMSCAFTHVCSVDAFKLRVCLPSLLYLSCLLVRKAVLFANDAFTNMGRPMRQWLRWKYHFTWSGPCTVSLGVGVVFDFGLFACMRVFFVLCMFVCLLACLLTCFAFTLASTFALISCLLVHLFHSYVSLAWNHVWILKRAG